MSIKTTINYSSNFDSKKRELAKIRFIVFHYTGMKKESEAISRLTDIQSDVSCHYLIKNNGEIIAMVPISYIAWHAGKSSWRNCRSLNKNSIGIEMVNSGHDFKYKKFSKKQVISLLRLSKFLIKKYKINITNILGHSDVAPERKKDPGEKFPWKYLSQNRVGLWHTIKKHVLLENRNIVSTKMDKEIFFKNLFKIGYSKKIPKNLNRDKYLRNITKTFQRRFRQELINSKIDRECLLISKNLLKRYN